MPRRPNIINEYLSFSGMETLNPKVHQGLYPEGMTATELGIMGDATEEAYEERGDPGAEDAQAVLRAGAQRSLMASMMSSSSRRKGRKQSKPIRVFADDDVEMGDVPHGAAEGAPGATPMEEAGIPGTDHRENLRMDVDGVVCDLCDDSFSSQAQLSEHVQSVHNLGNANEDSSFPTKYHQLGSQLQEAALNTIMKVDSTSTEQRFSPPNSQGENDSQASGDGSNRNRIFHQDAYCELCDREFCNKYFLKTHKANKHGIYENGGSDSPGSVSSQNGFPSMVPPLDSKLLPPTSIMPPSMPVSMPVSMPTSMPLSMSMPPVPTMEPITSQPRPPPPPPPASALPPQLQKSSTPTKPADAIPPKQQPTPPMSASLSTPNKPLPDMEDYCEICQKHFCNKYYLKKHKQDVHGIIPDTPPQKRSRTMPSSSSGGAISSNSIITTTAPAPLGIPHNPSAMSAANGLPNMTTMANVMFINPFAPPVTVLQPGMPPMPMGFLPQGIPGLPPQVPPNHPSVSVSEAGQINIKSGSNSPGNPNDALRGILNAEAYCDMCRKEFCNKYFLKIHLANKHGIFEDGLPTQPAGMPHIATSEGSGLPMSLVVAENGRKEGEHSPASKHSEKEVEKREREEKENSRSEEEKEKERERERKDKERKEKEKSDSEEFFCKICNKAYPNWYSLRIHQINVHEIVPQDLKFGQHEGMPGLMNMDPGEPGQKPFTLDGLNFNPASLASTSDRNISGTIFGNMIAAKLADRVVCDICNKEVCNKYFLKTHKMKVHGIDPSVIEKEREKTTPTKSIFQEGPTDLSKKPSPITKEGDNKRPPDEELLKMGIDPEAYCEICKKEFCSKYFLKTHKLNIHGIKVDNSVMKERTPPTSKSSTPQPAMMMLPSLATPPQAALPTMAPTSMPPMVPTSMPTMVPTSLPTMVPTSMPNMVPSSMQNMVSSSMPNMVQSAMLPQQLPPTPPFMSPFMTAQDLDGRCSWKWKEPINATRVMCELCNKELCNKYFLKTHMLNKHGINYDHITGSSTKSGSGSTGSTPAVSPGSKDGYPVISTEEMFKEHFAKMAQIENAMNKESVIKSTMSLNNKLMNSGVKSEEEMKTQQQQQQQQQQLIDNAISTIQAKTWHVPQESKDQRNISEDRKPLSERMTNGSHGDRASEGEPFIQKCDICGMLFGESITLQLHKMRDHKMPVDSPMPEYKVSLATSIGLSLRKKYQRRKLRNSRRWRRLGQCGAAIGDKVKSAIVNYVQNHQRRKKFRCAHCQERFFTRGQCQAHIRADHPSSRPADSSAYLDDQQRSNANSKNSSQSRRGSSPGGAKVPVSYAQARPLKERSTNYLMQSFQLEAKAAEQQEPPNFAASVVYLPVLQKISSPVTVTFTLTPTEQ